MSYEGDTGAPYTEGSGFGLADDPTNPNEGISRCADGVDTDQNNVDFLGGRPITPGAANNCPNGTPARTLKENAQADLAALLPTGDTEDDQKVQKAIDRIDESLNPDWWIDASTLDLMDGKDVFDREHQAVQELMKVSTVNVQAAIDALVDADRQLALRQLVIAVVAGGDPGRIANAQAAVADAVAHVAGGEFAKAVLDYKQAWMEAVKAL